MEAILSSQAADLDTLPPQLSYGLDPTGSFVLAKREATIYALGSSYSPSSVKFDHVIKLIHMCGLHLLLEGCLLPSYLLGYGHLELMDPHPPSLQI